MKLGQAKSDKLAIGLSLSCAIHCLAFPILLVSLPSLATLQLDSEAFHFWMVAAVIPTSIYALTLGCKQHQRYRFLLLGSIGLTLLILALVLGEDRIGEAGEKILTVIGSSFIVVSHWLNYRLCRSQKHANCPCPSDQKAGKA